MKRTIQVSDEGAALLTQVLDAITERDVIELARRVDAIGLNHARKRASLESIRRDLSIGYYGLRAL